MSIHINRNEGRHSVARAIFYGNRGEFRRPSRQGQEDQLAALGAPTSTCDRSRWACSSGLLARAREDVVLAAQLHDIGKLAIPDCILDKTGPLDDKEWTAMREHTLLGERILAAAPGLRGVAALVRSSHERWDGGGYPDGLTALSIPLGARIVTVCDAYDAMTSDRPYAVARAPESALAELRTNAGTQFDAPIVEALAAVVT